MTIDFTACSTDGRIFIKGVLEGDSGHITKIMEDLCNVVADAELERELRK